MTGGALNTFVEYLQHLHVVSTPSLDQERWCVFFKPSRGCSNKVRGSGRFASQPVIPLCVVAGPLMQMFILNWGEGLGWAGER